MLVLRKQALACRVEPVRSELRSSARIEPFTSSQLEAYEEGSALRDGIASFCIPRLFIEREKINQIEIL